MIESSDEKRLLINAIQVSYLFSTLGCSVESSFYVHNFPAPPVVIDVDEYNYFIE